MTSKKLCGYDVNGWRDGVARNWVARPGEEEEIGVWRIVEGAVLPDVVLAGVGNSERWIGGAQADLAPHGRGGGWGNTFGSPERRRTVRSLIHDRDNEVGVLAAAFRGLAQGASHSVASIEDTDRTTELIQERLFAALGSAQAGKPLLVWRSVLAVLYALEGGLLKGAAREGARIGIIGHIADGFSVQTLRLRAEKRGTDQYLTPERRYVGELFGSSLGYSGLVDAALAQVMVLAPDDRSEHFRSARSVGRLAFGLALQPEPLRRANGDWDILTPPATLQISLPKLPASLIANALQDCDHVLLESLTEGSVRSLLVAQFRDILPIAFTPLPAAAVAKGALFAAERLAAGKTVYLDFLPRIATIVQGAEGAKNYELIDEAETLPAGRLYRSPAPARLALLAGQEKFQVYLRKETHAKPRMARIDVGAKLREAVPIDLWVEQIPAAGRAKILMQAPSLSQQFAVDWDTAEVLDTTWAELLKDLSTPPPTIPARLVLPCGMHGWEERPNDRGLLSLLEENSRKARPDWDALAAKLTARPFGQYCISSDGQLPTEVSPEARAQLDELTSRALATVQLMVAGSMASNTAPLKFLTWQFRRCPKEIASLLLDAWAVRIHNGSHILATSASSWVLIRQGLGRIVSDPEHQCRALDLLLKRSLPLWRWREETAAAAFLLSRSDECLQMLERADVERLGTRVLREFEESVGTRYTTFNYAPFLLVGLLRWRLKSSRALVATYDPLADQFVQVVEKVRKDISNRSLRDDAVQQVGERWLPLLSQIVEEILGSGTNPDLLAAIYDA